jgi:hypothetical protein
MSAWFSVQFRVGLATTPPVYGRDLGAGSELYSELETVTNQFVSVNAFPFCDA